MEGLHNHSTNDDDKIMADICRVLCKCQPVLGAFANISSLTALCGLTDEETD